MESNHYVLIFSQMPWPTRPLFQKIALKTKPPTGIGWSGVLRDSLVSFYESNHLTWWKLTFPNTTPLPPKSARSTPVIGLQYIKCWRCVFIVWFKSILQWVKKKPDSKKESGDIFQEFTAHLKIQSTQLCHTPPKPSFVTLAGRLCAFDTCMSCFWFCATKVTKTILNNAIVFS